MEENKSYWINSRNRFVAFLDIMGFRDMIFRKSHQEVKDLLYLFHPTIKEIEDHAKFLLSGEIRYTNPEGTEDRSLVVRSVLFSDSIILISNGDSLISASYMFLHVGQILHDALTKGIPIKGAIAYGEQTADFERSIHFGRPLVDAYDLQSEIQLYGVALHHTVENYFETKGIDKPENTDQFKYAIPMYPVPLNRAKISHHIVNWTRFSNDDIEPIELVNKLYKSVSGNPRIYVDNTLEFVRWVIARNKEHGEK